MVRNTQTYSLAKSLLFATLIIAVSVAVVFSSKILNINTELRSLALVGDRNPITGTFFMQDFGSPPAATQQAMVQEMAATGIDTIILLAAGSLKKTPSGYEETTFVTNPNSMYRTILPLARDFNMKVYVGLAEFIVQEIPYWEGSPTDPNTDVGRIIDYSLRLIDATKQAAQEQGVPWDTVAGFYINEEAGPQQFNNPNSNAIVFFGRLSREIKAKEPTKKILLSPWLLEETTYKQAKSQYTNLLRGTAIDILAPQDSMGTRKVKSIDENTNHFRALRDAVAQFPGREAWANIESFYDFDDDGKFDPTTIIRLQSQIASAKPYVTKMITWIYQHTFLEVLYFNNIDSWTGQYTPQKAARRKILRQAYMETYVNPSPTGESTPSPATPQPAPASVENVFFWGDNVVIKGTGFGKAGGTVDVVINYGSRRYQERRIVYQEGSKQTIYISKTSLPGFNPTPREYVVTIEL